MAQWPALTQRLALGRLGPAADELLLVRDTGTRLPTQCQALPTLPSRSSLSLTSQSFISTTPPAELRRIPLPGCLTATIPGSRSQPMTLLSPTMSRASAFSLRTHTMWLYFGDFLEPPVFSTSNESQQSCAHRDEESEMAVTAFQPFKHFHKRQGFPQI